MPYSAPDARLLRAARERDFGLCRQALSEGADPNCHSKRYIWQGISPLVFALWGDDLPLVKLLIEAGADIHAEIQGRSPLMHAAPGACWKVVDLLLELGADISAKDEEKGVCFLDYYPWLRPDFDRNTILCREVFEREGKVFTLRSFPDGRNICPVCGSVDVSSTGEKAFRMVSDGGSGPQLVGGTYSPCDCDFEAGFDEASEESFAEYRTRWVLKEGLSTHTVEQLKNIGLKAVIHEGQVTFCPTSRKRRSSPAP